MEQRHEASHSQRKMQLQDSRRSQLRLYYSCHGLWIHLAVHSHLCRHLARSSKPQRAARVALKLPFQMMCTTGCICAGRRVEADGQDQEDCVHASRADPEHSQADPTHFLTCFLCTNRKYRWRPLQRAVSDARRTKKNGQVREIVSHGAPRPDILSPWRQLLNLPLPCHKHWPRSCC